MRLLFCFCIVLFLLLSGCKKDSTPVNFNCNLSGNMTTAAAISGNASTSFAASKFIITMNGPYSSVITIAWYNIDSPGAERGITARAYAIPTDTQSTPTLLASYTPQISYGGVYYYTGAGAGGTVTITNNTGPGGVISGAYSFAALNPSYPYDTVYLNNGTFTNVPVAMH